MKRPIFAILLTLVVASAIAVAVALAGPPSALFAAHMSDGGTSQAQGQANFMLNGNDLIFVMGVSNLVGDPTVAHIHVSADPGGNGPPFVTLCGAGPAPAPSPIPACEGPGEVKDTVWLSDEQIATLMTAISENRAYVNAHSTFAPGGEIRGQVRFR